MKMTDLYEYVDEETGVKRTIYEVLEQAVFPECSYDHYIDTPVVGRVSIMNPLGDYISEKEHTIVSHLDPKCWLSLRSDGKSFSKFVKRARSDGVLEKEYSLVFEEAMISAVRDVIGNEYYFVCAFTQSDEVTFLFRNADIRGDGQITNWNSDGSTVKVLTHQAGALSSRFTFHIMRQLIEMDKSNVIDKIHTLTFDCRFAQWDSFESAFQLIIWRAWDCMANGLSSGIHMINGITDKKAKHKYNSTDKLAFMESIGMLEKLTEHQKYGTFIYREKQESEKYIEFKKETVKFTKNVLQQVSYPLLTLVKNKCAHYDPEAKTLSLTHL